jgi:hypothetical protein
VRTTRWTLKRSYCITDFRGLDQKSRQNDATSFSYDGERQRMTRVVGEQHRSFGEADYFLVDRGTGGSAISKRTNCLNEIGCEATID